MRVSDHALLRWLERVYCLDLGQARRELAAMGSDDPSDGVILTHLEARDNLNLKALAAIMLTPKIRAAIAVGAKRVTESGVIFEIQGNCIATVIPAKYRLYPHGAKRGISEKTERRGERHDNETLRRRAYFKKARKTTIPAEGMGV